MPQTRSSTKQKNINYSESEYDKHFNAMISNNNNNNNNNNSDNFAKPVRSSKRKRKANASDSDDYKPAADDDCQPAQKRRKIYHHVDTPCPHQRRSTRIALKLSMHERDRENTDNGNSATLAATAADDDDDEQQQVAAAALDSEEKAISPQLGGMASARRSTRTSPKPQPNEADNVNEVSSDDSVVDFLPPQPTVSTVRRSARLHRSAPETPTGDHQPTTAEMANGWSGRLRAQQRKNATVEMDGEDDEDEEDKAKQTRRKDSDYDDEQFQNDVEREEAEVGENAATVSVEEEGDQDDQDQPELNGGFWPTRRRSKRLQQKDEHEHDEREHEHEHEREHHEDDDSLPIGLRRSRRNRRPPPRTYEEFQALELQRRHTLRARKPINYTESPDETQHGGGGAARNDGDSDDHGSSGDDGDEEYTLNGANRGRSRGRRRRSKRGTRASRGGNTRRRSRRRQGGISSGGDGDSSSESCSTDTFMELREQKRIARQRRKINPIQIHDLGLYHEGMAPNLAKSNNKATAADVSPMEIDASIGWNVVGGLEQHVQKLKEMVVLPLLYPAEFASFQMSTPKGVLFHGPPGTGKTLVARVLAAQCSMGCNADGTPRTKVSFYMRKGADCLSKWVGEAERQLRLLFDEAHKNQPAVIFFDEIDGLAPVRSSRQDQIHSSIVSTLLALMDGLDSRGQIIVIGATNRPDAIDPALRRPGRFDRELCFNLPSKEARKEILQIHTRTWQSTNCKLDDSLLTYLSQQSVGFCGADLEALCREAFLAAVRRTYPQIYHSNVRLQIDTQRLSVVQGDFEQALKDITPSSQRSSLVYARALPDLLRPLLDPQLETIRRDVSAIFALRKAASEEEDQQHNGRHCTQHYRYLIHGADARYGQSSLGTAVLHLLEEYPLYSMDLASIMGDSTTKCAEESILRMFKEAQRNTPSVLYWPHIDRWWSAAHDVLRTSLALLVDDIAHNCPILLLATADQCMQDLDEPLQAMFAKYAFHDCTQLHSEHQRRQFWSQIAKPMREQPQHRPKRIDEFEQLPVAEIPRTQPTTTTTAATAAGAGLQPTATESECLLESERMACVNLRTYIRAVCNRLCKHFRNFIDRTTDDGVVHNALSLFDIRQRNNARAVPTVLAFLRDIDELLENVKQSAQTESLKARQFINEACHLQDQALSMMSQVNRDLVKQCDKLAKKARQTQVQCVENDTETNTQQRRVVSFADEAPATQNGDTGNNHNSNSNSHSSHDKQEMEEDVVMEAPSPPSEVHASAAATEMDDGELQEETVTVEVDEQRLHAMIEKLVSVTQSMTVQEMEEKMYNLLRIIYQYSNRLVRTEMIGELEQHICTFFKHGN